MIEPIGRGILGAIWGGGSILLFGSTFLGWGILIAGCLIIGLT
jgi:hypothetical protein